MELEQTVFIPSERSVVWAGLNDPEILKRSLPGCEHFEVTGENQFEMVVTTRIGPVKATFRGKIELSNIEAPHRYVINGEGKGGVAGFAKGSASVELRPAQEEGPLPAQVSVLPTHCLLQSQRPHPYPHH